MSGATPGDSQAALRAYEAARLRLARMHVDGGATLAETLGEIAETAARTLAVDRVSVWLLIDERRAIPAADAREDPVTHELGPAYREPLGIVSLLDAPVYRGGSVIGVVCSESQTPRAWTAQERDFAASVADRVGTAFEEAARHDAEDRARDLEAAALDASRSEALGRVAAGIAHDFRNLLSVIVGFAHELRRSGTELPKRALEAAGEIERAAQRGADLARDLVGLGREEAQPTRVLDVADVSRACVDFARSVERIVLVDGKQLAGLMIDHEVGVHSRPLRVPKLDSDSFDE